jgi:hypothetical protein
LGRAVPDAESRSSAAAVGAITGREDVAAGQTIDRLVHREGYTLKGAKMALQGGEKVSATVHAPAQATAAVTASAPPLSAMSANFAYRARLIALRTTLVNALHEA